MKRRNIIIRPDRQKDNPLLKKLADIVKEHDFDGGFLLLIEKKPEDEDIEIAIYHRPGKERRKTIDWLINLGDEFISWYNKKQAQILRKQ